jgi:hypothetical protein
MNRKAEINKNINTIEQNHNSLISKSNEFRKELKRIENISKWEKEDYEFYLDFLGFFDSKYKSVETYKDSNSNKCRLRFKNSDVDDIKYISSSSLNSSNINKK